MAVGMGEEADRHLGIIREELVEHTKRWFALGQDFCPIKGIVHFPQLLDSDTRGEVELRRIGFALGTRIGTEAHILIEVVRRRAQHDILHSRTGRETEGSLSVRRDHSLHLLGMIAHQMDRSSSDRLPLPIKDEPLDRRRDLRPTELIQMRATPSILP